MRVRGSFVLAFGLCWFALASHRVVAHALDTADQRHAREEYAAGVAAFQRGDDAEARKHFSAADEAYGSPNVKLMLGRSLLRLGKLVAAHAALSAAVRQAREDGGGHYEQAATAAEQELQQLAPRLAVITLHVDDPSESASLRVGARDIPRSAWGEPIVSEPGAIEIALTGPSGRRDVKLLEMTGGTAATLEMSLPEAPLTAAAPSPPSLPAASARPEAVGGDSSGHAARSMSYVAAGVGAAGIVAFGVLGALSNAQFDQLKQGCPTRSNCDPGLQAHATQGRTDQALANVSLGVGIAALAAGVVLWVIRVPDERPEAAGLRIPQLRGHF
jgi:hypothetical protein